MSTETTCLPCETVVRLVLRALVVVSICNKEPLPSLEHVRYYSDTAFEWMCGKGYGILTPEVLAQMDAEHVLPVRGVDVIENDNVELDPREFLIDG